MWWREEPWTVICGNASSTVKDTKFKATKLIPNKEYIFRVAAENMYGVGESVQANAITAKFPALQVSQ